MKLESDEIKELAAEIAKLFSKRSWVDNAVRLLPILGILGWVASYEIQRWSSNAEAQEREKLEQVRFDENTALQQKMFEIQQLRADIDGGIAAYNAMQNGISNLKRVWYVTTARCAADPSYATDPRKIEHAFEERIDAESVLSSAGDMIKFSFGPETAQKIADYIVWDYGIKNACAKNAPSEKVQKAKQLELSKAIIEQIEIQQRKLTRLQQQLPGNPKHSKTL